MYECHAAATDDMHERVILLHRGVEFRLRQSAAAGDEEKHNNRIIDACVPM